MQQTAFQNRKGLNMAIKGILTVISGFSGAGKGTIVGELCKKENYALSISATTRAPRKGEVDGREYFFKTTEEFVKLIRDDGLIEWAQYVGNYYGTPKAYVEEMLARGKDVILEIEVQGAMNIKKLYPDAVLMFVTPPSAAILKERLEGRGTESADVIAGRMQRAAEECQYMDHYDYIIINDQLEDCVEQIDGILESYRVRKRECQEIIDKMTHELHA